MTLKTKTNRAHYLVLGIAAAFVIGSSSLIQPLYAVQKVQEIHLQRVETTTTSGFAFPLCGETDNFIIHILLRNYHFIGYSDSTFKVTSVTQVEYYDSAGKLVASSPQTQLFGDATSHNNFKVVEICAGPDQHGAPELNFHFGYTIGSDGIIKEIHFLSRS